MDDRKMRVDEDWKEQAEAEKRRLEGSAGARAGGAKAAKEAAATPGATGGPPTAAAPAGAAGPGAPHERAEEPGPVSFLALIEQLAAQAMAGLGQVPDPRTGQPYLDLELARDSIDMVEMLEQKTRGNLSHEEKRVLGDVLHSLRIAFSRVSRAAAQQMMQAAMPPGRGGPPPRAPEPHP